MKRLKQLMIERGVDDAKLSKELSCSDSTVYQWKVGTYEPRASYIKKICEFFQFSADDLLEIELPSKQKIQQATVNRLLSAVTKKGSYNSEKLHQYATAIRQKVGKLSELELWFREIAEALYIIESQPKKETKTQQESTQLRLFQNNGEI